MKLRRRKKKVGQALVEFALTLPLLFLLIINVVNFGAYLYAGIAISNAARAGANYMMMGPAYAGGPSYPTVTQISNLVLDDIASLPNHGTASVDVCTKNKTV